MTQTRSLSVTSQEGLDASLPPSGRPDPAHQPFAEAVTIAGMDDKMEMMASLQAPKKVGSRHADRSGAHWLTGIKWFALHDCTI